MQYIMRKCTREVMLYCIRIQCSKIAVVNIAAYMSIFAPSVLSQNNKIRN